MLKLTEKIASTDQVETNDDINELSIKVNFGISETEFKFKYNNHTMSFRNRTHENDSKLDQVDWGHRNLESDFLSDTVRGIFIGITGNRICCVATGPILFNSECFIRKINSFLHQDVSSAFQVITAINSRTIFYKEQQAFSNLCIFAFENVIV